MNEVQVSIFKPENAALAVTIYMTLLAASLALTTDSRKSHVLPLKSDWAPLKAHRFDIFQSLGMVVVGAGLGGALFCLECWQLVALVRQHVPDVSCVPVSFPPLDCSIDDAAQTSRTLTGGVFAGSLAALILIAWLMPSHSASAAARLGLAAFAFGASLDLITNQQASARVPVLLGGITALQITAHAAVALAIAFGSLNLPQRIAQVLCVHAAITAVRLCGFAAMMALWPYLTPALAVTCLVLGLMLPMLAICALVIAAGFYRVGKSLKTPVNRVDVADE